MADPVWTNQYNSSLGPEQGGVFTQNLTYSDPGTVNSVTSGNPSNRRLEIVGNTPSQGALWITSQVPTLDDLVGCTVEVLVQVVSTEIGGIGANAGFEMTFLNRAIGVQVHQDRITVQLQDGFGLHEYTGQDNSVQTLVRVTYVNGQMKLYRNTILLDTLTVPVYNNAFQRVLYWGEGQGTVTFRQLKFFTGGVVVP